MEICILREQGILDDTSGKEPACQCRRHKRCSFDPWAGKIPWRKLWQPTPVFLPGKSHGWRSLAVYGPQGHKDSDTLKLLSMQVCLLREHKIHKSSKRPQSKKFAVEIGSWNMESSMSDSLRPHGLQPTRLLCPWNFLGNSTGVDCHFLLQGIFPTQGSNPCLLHWQVCSLLLGLLGSPE